MQHLMKQFTHRVKETIFRALKLYTFLLSEAMLPGHHSSISYLGVFSET